jgi:hypothetical protein
MIIAVPSIALFAVSAMQILVRRDAVLDERRTTIRDMVEAAVTSVRPDLPDRQRRHQPVGTSYRRSM